MSILTNGRKASDRPLITFFVRFATFPFLHVQNFTSIESDINRAIERVNVLSYPKMFRVLVSCVFIVISFILCAKCSSEANDTTSTVPRAEKLTISIASALPPQIAYFVPDSAVIDLFNRTLMSNPVFNRTFQSLRPPAMPSLPPIRPSTMPDNIFDVMAAAQNDDYIAVANENKRRYAQASAEEDSIAANQNYKYDIDYLPDKHPNFWRFNEMSTARSVPVVRNKKVSTKKTPSAHSFHNFNSMNLRSSISELKKSHRTHFGADNDDGDHDNGDDGDDGSHERIVERKNKKKLKKKKSNQKKKLNSISSYESDNDFYAHRNTQNDDRPTKSGENFQSDEDEIEMFPASNDRKNKQFTFYWTKVRNLDNQKNRLRRPEDWKRQTVDEASTNDFVPTRLFSSVREVEKTVHKRRQPNRMPRIRSRLRESGGHVVYTEDGYEDKNYDHGDEKRHHSYVNRSRKRREIIAEILPIPEELKGQELLDHLTILIQNASVTLNATTAELKNRHFPLYNSTDYAVKSSSIRYAEHVVPFETNETSSIYDTKKKSCDRIDEDVKIDANETSTETSIPTKRLNGLGEKIDCLKEKLFGEDPLDNPLFLEENIPEPSPNGLMLTDSSVYDDVMHNIGHHQNQRIFSTHGISNNFLFKGIDSVESVSDELNTNEEYSNEQNNKLPTDSVALADSPSTERTKNSYQTNFHSFNGSPQVPILDISKFIPALYSTKLKSQEDLNYETDFVPVTKNVATVRPLPTKSPIIFQKTPPKKKPGIVQMSAAAPVSVAVPLVVSQMLNPNSFQGRSPPNVIIYRRRRPIAFIRFVTNGHGQGPIPNPASRRYFLK